MGDQTLGLRFSDPVLGLKFACAFLCITVIFWILFAIAKTVRIVNNQPFMSNIEAVILIMVYFFGALIPFSLLWSAIAWIIS